MDMKAFFHYYFESNPKRYIRWRLKTVQAVVAEPAVNETELRDLHP